MSNQIPKALFTNYIPTGIISANHIKVDPKIAEDLLGKRADNNDNKMPSEDQIKSMAKINPSIAKTIGSDNNIKGVRESSNSSLNEILEYNKSKKLKDSVLVSNRISRNHFDENNNVPKDKKIGDLKVDKNCLISKRVNNLDTKLSDISRDIIKADKREKYNNKLFTKEARENSSVMHGKDKDPITNISKGIKNISDRQVFSNFNDVNSIKLSQSVSMEELQSRAEIISTAYNIVKDRNQNKLDNMFNIDNNNQADSMNKLNQKIINSHKKTSERIDLMKKESQLKVDHQEAANLLQEYFKNKKSKGSDFEDIKEFNQNRSASIKEIKVAKKSTLDDPALPMKLANKQSELINQLVNQLPDNVLENIKKR